MKPSSPQVVDPNNLLGHMRELGLAPTKANYVVAMFHPEDPEFPLHAEIEAQIPDGLPGAVPESLTDLYPVKSSSKNPA